MPSVDRVVRRYRELRDEVKRVKERHVEELAVQHGQMRRMEAWLLATLQDQGADSMKTPDGTAYLTTTTKAKVVDMNALMKHVILSGDIGLLEQRVSASAVKEFVESEGELPPGVDTTEELNVRIRK